MDLYSENITAVQYQWIAMEKEIKKELEFWLIVSIGNYIRTIRTCAKRKSKP